MLRRRSRDHVSHPQCQPNPLYCIFIQQFQLMGLAREATREDALLHRLSGIGCPPQGEHARFHRVKLTGHKSVVVIHVCSYRLQTLCTRWSAGLRENGLLLRADPLGKRELSAERSAGPGAKRSGHLWNGKGRPIHRDPVQEHTRQAALGCDRDRGEESRILREEL